MFYVYIIQSKKDNNYYVGMTSDITKRLAYHNTGKVRSTKARIPFELKHQESFSSRIEAREREKYLKSYKGSKEKYELLQK
ncbi:MAG: GIY-YIG nuclease family protein [bacterium]